MINITPVAFPLGKGNATKLKVQVNPFSTSDTTCNLYYALFNEDGALMAEGNYALTEVEFAAWGQDNAYLENLVLSQLDLTRNENN
jgi:hypothetical protein